MRRETGPSEQSLAWRRTPHKVLFVMRPSALQENLGPDLEALAARFGGPGVMAIALAGSYVRGNAGPYSDVDLIRFVEDDDDDDRSGAPLLVSDEWLVSVSDVGPRQVDRSFSEPEVAVETIAGLRLARALVDPGGYFSAIQSRALAFRWTEELERKAAVWCSRALVGWVEEVHKGLEGLRRNDIGRLLNARHGLTWGLNGVVAVWKGVLLSGDNAFFDEVAQAVGPDSAWVALRRRAFGVEDEGGVAPLLREQVSAGLMLFVATAEMMRGSFRTDDAQTIAHAIKLIRAAEPAVA